MCGLKLSGDGTTWPIVYVEPSIFFFSSRRRHTRCSRDWSSDVCSSDLLSSQRLGHGQAHARAAGVARPSATGGVRARQGCLGSRRCHKCPVAGCQQGRRSRSARDRLAQPSPEASHRSRHTLGGNMQRGANARFAIKQWDEKPYSEGKDVPKLTRASVTKTFTGDIEGERSEERRVGKEC